MSSREERVNKRIAELQTSIGTPTKQQVDDFLAQADNLWEKAERFLQYEDDVLFLALALSTVMSDNPFFILAAAEGVKYALLAYALGVERGMNIPQFVVAPQEKESD